MVGQEFGNDLVLLRVTHAGVRQDQVVTDVDVDVREVAYRKKLFGKFESELRILAKLRNIEVYWRSHFFILK